MATTTPNYGWPVPTSTDLVKNGATAIEGLGDAIDASLLDLKGGTTGQVLAKASGTDMDFSWVAIDPLVILDAKGDLITATAADTPARLAVGTNAQVLTADSTTATGLKWATASSGLSAATQAEMESASSTAVAVTPARQQYHPSAAKAWVQFNGTSTYTINASYNVSSVSSIGTAQYRISWSTAFSSASYAYSMNCEKLTTAGPTTGTMIVCNTFTQATGYIDIALMCIDGTRTEPPKITATAFGDQ
jgi:hypothetical protein